MSDWPAAMKLSTAAKYLEVETSYVERLLREGDLRACQLRDGGDRRITRKELDRYLDKREQMGVKSA